MKIELQAKDPKPPQEQILADGQEVGWVVTTDRSPEYRFHVGLYVRSTTEFSALLVQGHGSSVENAVDAAMSGGLQKAKDLIDGIAELKRLLGD